MNIDIIISSPLRRAVETAKIVETSVQGIIIDFHFIERSVGIYEGFTKNEIKSEFPDLYKQNLTRRFDNSPPKKETIKNVQNRVFAGINRITERYKDKNVIIITHAFVAKVINKYFNPQITEKDFFDFVLQNAEIKEYSCS